MFAEMASYTLSALPTWRDPQGDLWEPNTTIVVAAPEAMIYTPTEFLIRRVTLSATPEERKASLDLVLPGAFSGSAPKALPWVEE